MPSSRILKCLRRFISLRASPFARSLSLLVRFASFFRVHFFAPALDVAARRIPGLLRAPAATDGRSLRGNPVPADDDN